MCSSVRGTMTQSWWPPLLGQIPTSSSVCAAIARHRLDAGANDPAFYRAKITTARFFADHFLSQAAGLSHVLVSTTMTPLAAGDG